MIKVVVHLVHGTNFSSILLYLSIFMSNVSRIVHVIGLHKLVSSVHLEVRLGFKLPEVKKYIDLSLTAQASNFNMLPVTLFFELIFQGNFYDCQTRFLKIRKN